MKTKCCRDTPRCAGCPVLLRAAARKQREVSEFAALFHEIFAGRQGRAIPACVTAALEELDAARHGPAARPLAEAQLR